MRRVIRDYFAAFRIDRIKAGYRSGNPFTNWFPIVYVLFVMPASLQVFTKSLDVTIRFFVTGVLLLFDLYAAPLHPISLPKLLYLCPMSETERRDYIRKSYGFKIGFPVGLSALGMAVLWIFGKINGIFGLVVIAETGAIAICGGIMGRAQKDGYAREKKPSDNFEGRDGWETLAIIVSVACAFFTMLYAVWLEDFWDIMSLVCVVCMVCMELPLTILMIRRVKPAQERALNYEGITVEKSEKP